MGHSSASRNYTIIRVFYSWPTDGALSFQPPFYLSLSFRYVYALPCMTMKTCSFAMGRSWQGHKLKPPKMLSLVYYRANITTVYFLFCLGLKGLHCNCGMQCRFSTYADKGLRLFLLALSSSVCSSCWVDRQHHCALIHQLWDLTLGPDSHLGSGLSVGSIYERSRLLAPALPPSTA